MTSTQVVKYNPFQKRAFVPDPAVELTFDAWQGYYDGMLITMESLPWWVGDLINLGEAKWGEKYAQALEATGKPVEQLMNWANVARKVSFRNEKLSWTHHRHVASLDPEKQREWLDTAEAEDWTSAELKEHMRGSEHVNRPEPKGPSGVGSESAGPKAPASGLDDEVDVDQVAPEVHDRLPEGQFMSRPIRYQVVENDGLTVRGPEELLLALMNVVDG